MSKRHTRAETQAADPATLAAMLRPRAISREADPATQAYVLHWDICRQCHGAADDAGLCALGKHLYHKWRRNEGHQ
jgi:hypothetical protein